MDRAGFGKCFLHKDCFGYVDGRCRVLHTGYKEECPYYKTKVQYAEEVKKYAKKKGEK